MTARAVAGALASAVLAVLLITPTASAQPRCGVFEYGTFDWGSGVVTSRGYNQSGLDRARDAGGTVVERDCYTDWTDILTGKGVLRAEGRAQAVYRFN